MLRVFWGIGQSAFDNECLGNEGVRDLHSVSSPSRMLVSLIIGDGVLQFVTDARLTSLGQDFVHAHEFDHHLQYEMDSAYNVPEGYENDM